MSLIPYCVRESDQYTNLIYPQAVLYGGGGGVGFMGGVGGVGFMGGGGIHYTVI